jgi:hypothetical protein
MNVYYNMSLPNKEIVPGLSQIKIIVEELVIMIVSKPHKKPFQLNSNHLYQPEHSGNSLDSSSKIYITRDIRYNKKILLKLNYKNRLQFLFNKKYFNKKIQTMVATKNDDDISKNTTDDPQTPVASKNTDDILKNDKREIFKYNVLITLQLLFPTYFPILSNNANSYDQYINNHPLPLSSSTSIIAPFKYSYIKIENKPYTIIKSVWLNDYINHPLYQTLYNEYNRFITWKDEESSSITKDISGIKLKLNDTLTLYEAKFNNENEIINKYIIELDKQENDYTKKNILVSSNTLGMKDKYIKLRYNVDELIIMIKDNNMADLNIQTLYNNLSDIIYFINKNEGYTYRSILSKEFKTNIKHLYKIVENVYALDEIKKSYFNDNRVNINIQNKDQIITDLLKTKYSIYVSFINLFSQYVKPLRESSNYNFQELLNKFVKNDTTEFSNFNKHIDNFIYTNVIDASNNELSYIGINTIISNDKSSKYYYEIYVGLDLIDGIIDDSNVNNINCNFKSFALGNQLENILSKQSTIIYHPEYYKFDNNIDPTQKKTNVNNNNNKIDSAEKKTSINNNNNNKIENLKKKQKGGITCKKHWRKYNTRKIQRYKSNTRKIKI